MRIGASPKSAGGGRTIMKENIPQTDENIGGGKKGRWAIVSIVIAALSIWAVTSQWKGFSLGHFIDYVSRAKPGWLACAIVAMLGFVFFEGCALHAACHALHYDPKQSRCFSYAAADIYFSAITPSASGGQPACAYLMMKDGIPGIVSTAVLLLTLAMYAMSILVIGIVSFLVRPSVLMAFGVPSRILIGVGFAIQIGLAALFILLIKSENLLESLCRGTIGLLAKLHLLRRKEERLEKLERTMAEYRDCVALLSGHRPMLIKSFLFNLLQRASQIAVTMLVYLAMGGRMRRAIDIFAMQSYVVLGSNCVPIPGAMGVADYLMLDGFNAFLAQDQVAGMELLSRTISFYSCVLLCGITVLIVTHKLRKVVRR